MKDDDITIFGAVADPGEGNDSILDADFGIAVRVGLHCASLVHESLGTFPQGGIRFSLGAFNIREDIDRALAAMAKILSKKSS